MDLHTFGYETTNHDGSISYVEWDVRDFWLAAKGKPTKLFDTQDLMKQVREAIKEYDDTDEERIKKANLKYPIILSPGMKLLDGVHRLVKQHRMGIRQVKCVVLDVMPKPINLEGPPFAIAGIPFVWSLESQGVTMPITISEDVPDDLADFVKVLNQAAKDPFVGFIVPTDYVYKTNSEKMELVREMFTKGVVGDMQRLVAYYADGKLIGFSQPCDLERCVRRCGLYKVKPEQRFWKTGTIFIRLEERNKGFACAILKQFIGLFGNIAWSAREDNIASQKVAERAGLRFSHDLYVVDNHTNTLVNRPTNKPIDEVYKVYKTA